MCRYACSEPSSLSAIGGQQKVCVCVCSVIHETDLTAFEEKVVTTWLTHKSAVAQHVKQG